MKESKILLIGGNGFLGKSLYEELKKNKFTNIYICSREITDIENHIKGNILDIELVQRLINLEFNLIINLTGQVTNPIDSCLSLNSLGIQNIVKIVKNSSNCKLVQISTVGVYGSCSEANEDTLLNPDTPYSTAKAMAEKLLVSELPSEKLVIFRLSNLYGQEQLKGIFAYLIRSAKSDSVLDFNNDGSLIRYFLHTKDCASIIVHFIMNHIESKSGVYNVIGHEKYSLLQLIGLIENLKNIKFKVNLEPIKPYDNTITIFDNKIKALFLYSHTMDIKTYLSKF